MYIQSALCLHQQWLGLPGTAYVPSFSRREGLWLLGLSAVAARRDVCAQCEPDFPLSHTK